MPGVVGRFEIPLGTTFRRFNLMETEHPAKFAPEVLLPSLGRGVDHVVVENTHLALSQVRHTDLVHWGTDQDNWHISIATHRPQLSLRRGRELRIFPPSSSLLRFLAWAHQQRR